MSKYKEDEQMDEALRREDKRKHKYNIDLLKPIFVVYYCGYSKITHLHNYTTQFRTFISKWIFNIASCLQKKRV